MAAINVQQIRKIYAIGRKLGIVEQGSHEDILHSLVAAVTGKTSVKALTSTEAKAVISELEERQGGIRPGMSTKGQRDKVWALMYDLVQQDTTPSAATEGQRLCGIIKKELGINARTGDPFVWINFRDCNKLIEVLKQYVANAKRRSARG